MSDPLGPITGLFGSQMQADAVTDAAETSSDAQRYGIDVMYQMWQQAQEDFAPYLEAGGQGLSILQGYMPQYMNQVLTPLAQQVAGYQSPMPIAPGSGMVNPVTGEITPINQMQSQNTGLQLAQSGQPESSNGVTMSPGKINIEGIDLNQRVAKPSNSNFLSQPIQGGDPYSGSINQNPANFTSGRDGIYQKPISSVAQAPQQYIDNPEYAAKLEEYKRQQALPANRGYISDADIQNWLRAEGLQPQIENPEWTTWKANQGSQTGPATTPIKVASVGGSAQETPTQYIDNPEYISRLEEYKRQQALPENRGYISDADIQSWLTQEGLQPKIENPEYATWQNNQGGDNGQAGQGTGTNQQTEYTLPQLPQPISLPYINRPATTQPSTTQRAPSFSLASIGATPQQLQQGGVLSPTTPTLPGAVDFQWNPDDEVYKYKLGQAEDAQKRYLASIGMSNSSPALTKMRDTGLAVAAEDIDKQFARQQTERNYLAQKAADEYAMQAARGNTLYNRQMAASNAGLAGTQNALSAYDAAMLGNLQRPLDVYGNLYGMQYGAGLDLSKIGAGQAGSAGASSMQAGNNLMGAYGNIGETQANAGLANSNIWANYLSGLQNQSSQMNNSLMNYFNGGNGFGGSSYGGYTTPYYGSGGGTNMWAGQSAPGWDAMY